MYFMYVDESGDPGPLVAGTPPSVRPSLHYILTGVIIPAVEWRNYVAALVDIRRYVKSTYKFPIRTELKGSNLINPRGNADYGMLGGRFQRVRLYRDVLMLCASRLTRARILNVHWNKQKPFYSSTATAADCEQRAWEWLIQRFDTFLKKDGDGSLGLIFADDTNEVKVRRILRRMRVYNLVPSHYGGTYPAPVVRIVEDPVMRNSQHSYFVQFADMVAHALYRKLYPRSGYRRYNADRLFDLVAPLLVTDASRNDPHRQGIVHL